MKHYYDLGFDCYGVEPGHENVEAARKKMPRANLAQGYFDEDWARQFPPEMFDLVIITSVFEHLPEPGKVLATLRQCVAPDGRLFMVVPDLSFYAPTLQIPRTDRDRYGCSQLLFFYRNVFLCYAQHINHFSGPSLTRYLAAFGLQTLQVANVAHIWMLAAPAEKGDDSFDYPDLVEYHSTMMDHYEGMLRGMRRAISDKLKGRRLVCYGAGREFGYSQEIFRLVGIEALAVADDSVTAPQVHGVPCVTPDKLASFEPEICLATSFDYENEIGEKARRVLPESTEVLTLTSLMYEAEWTMPRFTDYMLKPALDLRTPVLS